MYPSKIEQRAQAWLESQGYKILYHRTQATPDFETDKGSFEVKALTIIGRLPAVYFTDERQLKAIVALRTKLLVFKKDEEAPKHIIEPEDLEIGNVPFRVKFSFPSPVQKLEDVEHGQ